MSFPDYYALLGVAQNANSDAIRQAYKRESLKSHPDRVPNATPQQRQEATEKFQAVADAYYVLSDPSRRKEYDLQYSQKTFTDRTAEAGASGDFFANFARMFAGAGAGASTSNASQPAPGPFGERPDPNHVFGDVFDELLRPEVESRIPLWTFVGAVCGGGMGFIIANLPGLFAGAIAGNRLGAIRDAKGRSVASVFTELPGAEKAAVLRALAMKVLGSALG